jgi:hypothetical protein
VELVQRRRWEASTEKSAFALLHRPQDPAEESRWPFFAAGTWAPAIWLLFAAPVTAVTIAPLVIAPFLRGDNQSIVSSCGFTFAFCCSIPCVSLAGLAAVVGSIGGAIFDMSWYISTISAKAIAAGERRKYAEFYKKRRSLGIEGTTD